MLTITVKVLCDHCHALADRVGTGTPVHCVAIAVVFIVAVESANSGGLADSPVAETTSSVVLPAQPEGLEE
ncbi:hypothetical protein HYQ46_002032 [Verticillium longisporum]|nr:hypothetical protein HYQ46_002032 [Verticillium longisporum]